MSCLMEKMCDKDIGKRLEIETNTVHVHMFRLVQRLGVHNRHEAVQKFFQHCLETSCRDCSLSQSIQVCSGMLAPGKTEE